MKAELIGTEDYPLHCSSLYRLVKDHISYAKWFSELPSNMKTVKVDQSDTVGGYLKSVRK